MSQRENCLLACADVAGLYFHCHCVLFIACKGQGGQMLRSLENCLQVDPEVKRTGQQSLGGRDGGTLVFLLHLADLF